MNLERKDGCRNQGNKQNKKEKEKMEARGLIIMVEFRS